MIPGVIAKLTQTGHFLNNSRKKITLFQVGLYEKLMKLT